MSEPTEAEKASARYTMASAAYLCTVVEKYCEQRLGIIGGPAGESLESVLELLDVHWAEVKAMVKKKGRFAMLTRLQILQDQFHAQIDPVLVEKSNRQIKQEQGGLL